MLVLMMFFFLFFAVLRIGLKLAWGGMKLMFGLALFWVCPLLFVISAVLGLFGSMLIPIILIGLLCGRGFAINN